MKRFCKAVNIVCSHTLYHNFTAKKSNLVRVVVGVNVCCHGKRMERTQKTNRTEEPEAKHSALPASDTICISRKATSSEVAAMLTWLL